MKIILILSGLNVVFGGVCFFLYKLYKNNKKELKTANQNIKALEADRSRLTAVLEDIRIIENKRNETNEKIKDSDDDNILDIVNGMLN